MYNQNPNPICYKSPSRSIADLNHEIAKLCNSKINKQLKKSSDSLKSIDKGFKAPVSRTLACDVLELSKKVR